MGIHQHTLAVLVANELEGKAKTVRLLSGVQTLAPLEVNELGKKGVVALTATGRNGGENWKKSKS